MKDWRAILSGCDAIKTFLMQLTHENHAMNLQRTYIHTYMQRVVIIQHESEKLWTVEIQFF